MQPRQMRETERPVRPSRVWFMRSIIGTGSPPQRARRGSLRRALHRAFDVLEKDPFLAQDEAVLGGEREAGAAIRIRLQARRGVLCRVDLVVDEAADLGYGELVSNR